jgi:hypothetical protein
MAKLSNLIDSLPAAGKAIASVVAGIMALGAGTAGVLSFIDNYPDKRWVVEHVDQRFEAEAYRQQVRDDLMELRALKEKASDPDVIAGLERQIAELEARLEG